MSETDPAGPAIAVPQGGGALQGVGEKFSPDLHTGTGNLSVPIAVPPGRRGHQPQLALTYSSGSGNGPCGIGWNVTVPLIARVTSKGIPRYLDTGAASDRDLFALSDTEELVELPLAAGAGPQTQRFRPRTEGLFAQIERNRAAGADYWTVRTKDGLSSTYGSADSTVDCTVADPDATRKVFNWRLTETRDPFGNRITYSYRRDRVTQASRSWDQLYIKQIAYADLDGPNDAPFFVTVEFVYDDESPPAGILPAFPVRSRPDPFSNRRAGFEIRTRRRCKWIVVRTHPDNATSVPVRAYELAYLDEIATDPAVLPRNSASLLSRIEIIGFDDTGAAQREMAPLQFSYSAFAPEKRKFAALIGDDLPATSLGHQDFDLVDLFGRGLPDVLELGDTARFWRNLGGGRFDRPKPLTAAPAGLRLSNTGVQIVDADGDGRADLLITQDIAAGYYTLDFNGAWDARSFTRYQQAPSFSLEDADVRLVDLTGDGVVDALRSGTRFECYFNDAVSGWLPQNSSRIPRRALDQFPDVSFSDPRVKLVDMTGDGLQDIVFLHSDRLDYWPNRGYGLWGARITLPIPDRLPFDFDPQRVVLGDVDGDGVADLIYIDDREISLWINCAGNSLSARQVFRGTPSVTNNDSVRLVDLLGTGVACLVGSRTADGSGRPNHFFFDMTGGVKPYLLNHIDNNIGATVDIDYSPSTTFYLQDQKLPTTRWRTTLPFPVQVVSGVTTRDAFSGGTLTSEYHYHHGYWDGVEREFRGFGMVEHLDTEVFDAYQGRGVPADPTPLNRLLAQSTYAAPILTRTWFHQGPVARDAGDEWIELDESDEFAATDPNFLGHLAGVNAFLLTVPPSARRAALRALRGNVLRSELYSLDGSELQDLPYTVSEYAFGLREEEPPAAGDTRERIFLPMTVADRTTQWERGNDPQTQINYLSGYDAVGQPSRKLSIACPRGWRGPADTPAEGFLAALQHTQYVTVWPAQTYIRDRVARSRSFELTQTAGASVTQLAATDETSAGLRLFAEMSTFYDYTNDATQNYGAFAGLPFGQIANYGAPVRVESLVLTDGILDAAYGIARPPYLVPGGALNAGPNYPAAFVAALAASAGYVYRQATAQNSAGYFVVSTSNRYDFHTAAATGKGLMLGRRNELGQESTIVYDVYDLAPARIRNPAGLETVAEYNMRVRLPSTVTDVNGNLTRVSFSPLGLVSDTWAIGKLGAAAGDAQNCGDRNSPSVHVEYDFLAYIRSRAAGAPVPQPIYTRAVRRVFHDSDSDDSGETLEARRYSDGFGRGLQTRTLGEDYRFGDGHFGGGDDVLPVSQATAAPGTVIGLSSGTAEAPNVIVTGWQRYDNKGQVIERFEPSWSSGWDYEPPVAVELGESVQITYDPRGQPLRTLNPDGSEVRVVYGIPSALDDPPLSALDSDKYQPTPWESYTYDPNDNAGRTHAADPAAALYRHHWNTPSSVEIDSLGRAIRSTVRNRAAPASSTDPLAPVQEYSTLSLYDIQGNVLSVQDALGRTAFKYAYDLTKRALRTESLDAGVRLAMFDAAGGPVEAVDSRSARVLHAYDTLHRKTRLWARDDVNATMTVRERVVYGDDAQAPGTVIDKQNGNLLGRVWEFFDEAGSGLMSYDFKGNSLTQTRSALSDDFLLADVRSQAGPTWLLSAPRVDWDATPTPALDPVSYQTRNAFDALNRLKHTDYPDCANGERYRVVPTFNRADALESVAMIGPLDNSGAGPSQTFVERIAYNAKGQRVLAVWGNGIMTRYAYNTQTLRLSRLRSEHVTSVGAASYSTTGQPLQELAYGYDLVGNIQQTTERVSGCGIRNSLAGADALDRFFSYDPLYRLVSAGGRECSALSAQRSWDDYAPCGFNGWSQGTPNLVNAPDMTGPYREQYAYDPVGNLTSFRHDNGGTSAWARYFGMGGFTPRTWQQMLTTWAGGGAVNWGMQGNQATNAADGDPDAGATHTFDAAGNTITQLTERHFEWDHQCRMKAFRNQVNQTQPTAYALYLYDSAGTRVKKLVWNAGGYSTVTYIGGTFERHKRVNAGVTTENCLLHIMDGARRIAISRVGAAFADDGAAAYPTQFHLGDHLESTAVVISSAGDSISREEYYPFGETSFGGFGRKRFRFVGKERDEESGFGYHGARYLHYAIGRWTSADRAGAAQGVNLFSYAHGNPIRLIDTNGFAIRDPRPLSGNRPPGVEGEEFESLPNVESQGSRIGNAARGAGRGAGASEGAGEAALEDVAVEEALGEGASLVPEAVGAGATTAGVLFAFVGGTIALVQNSLSQEATFRARFNRRDMGTAMYQAGILTNSEVERFVRSGELPVQRTRGVTAQRWFEIGREFERYVFDNARLQGGAMLRDLFDQGRLSTQFPIRQESDPNHDRIPDFYAWRNGAIDWVGDAKLGAIDVTQGMAFVDEAALSRRKLLVYFVPDETVQIPDALLRYARSHLDAAGHPNPVNIRRVFVHGFDSWIPAAR